MKLKYNIEKGCYVLGNGRLGFAYQEMDFKLPLSNANTCYILELVQFINPAEEVENLVPLY